MVSSVLRQYIDHFYKRGEPIVKFHKNFPYEGKELLFKEWKKKATGSEPSVPHMFEKLHKSSKTKEWISLSAKETRMAEAASQQTDTSSQADPTQVEILRKTEQKNPRRATRKINSRKKGKSGSKKGRDVVEESDENDDEGEDEDEEESPEESDDPSSFDD
ncbi:hypothetical protein CRG98_009526 [Punica granatum]|uniref:Uncharacterized protein n=1 Tax=Punica granatum TaxID=22663 RepID=A0A2I0KP56_PUNGR|nr:hypothetical protein CRG98_009526 [Punica granatum]